MTETSKLIRTRLLAVLALAAVACSVEAGNQIPCADDFSCPNDYPVCVSGKCAAGTSTAKASVAIVGPEGHATTDFLSGTVRVIVSAKASSGVQSVALAAGSTAFTASTAAATPPLYAFDVDTTALADGDRQLTATLTAGDGATATANGTLHVDNAKPVITSFTVAGGTSTTITAGSTATISASFTGGTTAAISDGSGTVSIASSGSILVSPDVLTSYSLRVTSRSGVIVQSGTPGQPPDVSVGVVGPASFTGNASVSPTSIQQGQAGSFTFTAPTFGSGMTAIVKDAAGATKGSTTTSGGPISVTIPATLSSTTELDYTVVISNAATIPDSVSIPLVVHVGAPPTIISFGTSTAITLGSSATLQATFTGGNGVITPGNIPITSGGTVVVAPTAPSTSYTLTVTNPTTSVSVATGAGGQPSNVTVAVVAPPVITEFTSSSVHVTSGEAIPLSIETTGVSGSVATVTVACTEGSILGFTIPLSGGNGFSNPNPTAPTTTSTSTCTFTATVQNAASTSVVSRVVVTVEPAPTITSSFVFAVSGTNTAFFARGDTVALNHTYNAHGGTATINGIAAGATSTTFADIQSDTLYTLTVTNLAGATAVATATATIAPGAWFLLNSNSSAARQGVTVTALDAGKVLIAGGATETGTVLNTAVVCDFTGDCSSPITMKSPRAFHTAVRIPPAAPHNAGLVLLAGGYTTNLSTPTVKAEFFDPGTNTFANTTDITATTVTDARARHIAVLLDSRHVLIAGGSNGTDPLASAVNYDAGAATPAVADVSGPMAQPRMDFTGTLLNGGKVLVVGGAAGNDTSELFNPTGSGTFNNTGEVSTTGLEDKRGHTATLIMGSGGNAGKVLISGGVTGSGTASATQFLYDPAGATSAATVGLRTARSHHAAISLPNTNVLICGGIKGTTTLASCERFDPDFATQIPTAPMLEPRKDFGLASMGSTVVEEVAAGGTDTTSSTTAETYNAN